MKSGFLLPAALLLAASVAFAPLPGEAADQPRAGWAAPATGTGVAGDDGDDTVIADC